MRVRARVLPSHGSALAFLIGLARRLDARGENVAALRRCCACCVGDVAGVPKRGTAASLDAFVTFAAVVLFLSCSRHGSRARPPCLDGINPWKPCPTLRGKRAVAFLGAASVPGRSVNLPSYSGSSARACVIRARSYLAPARRIFPGMFEPGVSTSRSLQLYATLVSRP